MAVTRLMQKTVLVKDRDTYTALSPKRIRTYLYATGSVQQNNSEHLFVDFEDVPENIKLHAITGARLYIFSTTDVTNPPVNELVTASAHALSSPIRQTSGYQHIHIDTSNVRAFTSFSQSPFLPGLAEIDLNTEYTDENVPVMPDLLRYGIRFDFYAAPTYFATSYSSIRTYFYADDEHPVYIDLETSDDKVYGYAGNLSPRAGFVDEKKAQKFSWDILPSFENYAGQLRQTSARLQWRAAGSETITSYECGESMSFTVPAGVFPPTGTVEWRIELTDNGGHTDVSDWTSFYTTEATSTAVAVSPSNDIKSSAEPIEFTWKHRISTGTSPTGADLEYSTDGYTFQSFAHTYDAQLSFTAPPDVFPGGRIYWRVRTYNSDNLPGAWSDPLEFVSIGAPPAPIPRVDASPRPLISWQSAVQHAWQLEIPGVWSTPPMFGYDYSYKIPTILDDGHYEARVRVQNDMGLWSEWASVSFDVLNFPAADILLEAFASGANAELIWTTAAGFDKMLIYRNGELIGKTSDIRYTDSFANGYTEYTVRGLIGDNYTDSNASVIDINIDTAAICTVDDKEWLPLRLSQRSTTQQEMSYTREGDFVHVTGARFPIAEVSKYETETVRIDCAFIDEADSQRLKAMRGKLVCLKLRRGEMVIGPLLTMERTLSDFYDTYEISIRRTHFEEVVSIEDD